MDSRKKTRIEKITKKILNESDLLHPGYEINELLNYLEIPCYLKDLPPNIYGASKITDEETIISINKNNAPARQRFSIAHELGHIYLHQESSLNVSDRLVYAEFNRNDLSAAGTDDKEIEANYFAACLLMPEDLLLSEVEELNYSIGEDEIKALADKFKVSTVAMTIRLSRLGFN